MKFIQTLKIYPREQVNGHLKQNLSNGFTPWVMADDGCIVAFNCPLWSPLDSNKASVPETWDYWIDGNLVGCWWLDNGKWVKKEAHFRNASELLYLIGLPSSFPLEACNDAIERHIKQKAKPDVDEDSLLHQLKVGANHPGYCGYGARGSLYGRWSLNNEIQTALTK